MRDPARPSLAPLVLSVLLLTGGCGAAAGDGDAARGGDADLEGRTFLSTQVRGHTLVEGSRVTLTFADGRVVANAGCNTMSGGASWDGPTLTVDDALAMTEMGCPPDLAAQDEWLSGFLTSGPALALDGATLELGDDTAGMTLNEREDLPLEATAWTLDGLIEGEAVSSVPAGVEAGIRLTGDGRMNVSAGCNRGSGPVIVEAANGGATGTLEVGPVATTKMLCADDAMAVEEHVLSVLDGTVDYRVDGTTLTLTTGDRGLSFTAPESA